MFPFQQSDELCFKISSQPNQRDRISGNQILSSQCYEPCDARNQSNCVKSPLKVRKSGRDERRKLNRKSRVMSSGGVGVDADGNEKMKNKMIHRDIEKQRRRDMTTLCASLRCLLPLEFIKGKRSISDQMNEAVNYIKHLQRNIGDLTVKRDGLKDVDDHHPSFGSENRRHHALNPSSCVIVRPCLIGVEILLSGDLTLSSLVHAVTQEGYSVLSCVSTRVNDKFHYTIHGQANDPTQCDPAKLQQKLTRSL